jgi:hypothetical protein
VSKLFGFLFACLATSSVFAQPEEDSLKKYSYLLVQYNGQPDGANYTASSGDEMGTATGFFVRVKKRLFLVSNYHVITSVDVYHKERYPDQFGTIKIRYYDRENKIKYFPVDVDSIRRNSQIISFDEYPDLYVLEIKGFPKDARLFSVEKMLYAKDPQGNCSNQIISYQYLPQWNQDVQQQLRQIVADRSQRQSFPFNFPVDKSNGISVANQREPMWGQQSTTDSSLASILSSPINSNFNQQPPSGQPLFLLNDTARPSFVLTNIIDARPSWLSLSWGQHLTTDSALTSIFSSPINSNLYQQPPIGQPLYLFNDTAGPSFALTNSMDVYPSWSSLSNGSPVPLSGNPFGVGFGGRVNPDSNINEIILFNSYQARPVNGIGLMTIDTALSNILPFSNDNRLFSYGPVDQSVKFMFNTDALPNLSGKNAYGTPIWPNSGQSITTVFPDSVIGNLLSPNTSILNGENGQAPPTILYTLPNLTGLTTIGLPPDMGIVPDLNNTKGLTSISPAQLPNTFSFMTSVDVNRLAQSLLPARLVDQLNLDDVDPTLYSGHTVDENVQHSLLNGASSMYLLLTPATDHGSSGSPVFFKCSCELNGTVVDKIIFAGVQSGINEQIHASAIVKPQELIKLIADTIGN